MTNKCTII